VVLAAQGEAGGVSWDGFQREALAELGISVYALTDAPVENIPPPSPLLLALLRAAAADIHHEQALALCRDFLAAHPNPSIQARRTLWPQLRRLRATAA